MLDRISRLAPAMALLALAAAPSAEVQGERHVVTLRVDRAQHRSFLSDLARERRAGDAERFLERLAAGRAAQDQRRAPLEEWLEGRGARVIERFWLTPGLAIENADAATLAALAARPDVLSVEPDALLEAQLMADAIDADHHDAVGAHALYLGSVPVRGTGVTVALIDSGVDSNMNGTGRPHAAFYPGGDPNDLTGGGIGGSRLLSEEHYGFPPPSVDEDLFGHGTRMGAVLAGARWNAQPGVADGIAPDVWIRSFKISDDGVGELASTVSMGKAFDAAAAMPDVRVANMSYNNSSSLPGTNLNRKIDAATLAGVFVTLSGGNFGADLSVAHGAYNALVAGASLKTTKQPAVVPGIFTSAIGPLPDGRRYPHMLAVGTNVVTAKLDDEASSQASYGASASAAMLAGTGALVVQCWPAATQLQIKALLLNESQEVVLGNPAAAGWGYLDVEATVDAAIARRAVTETVSVGQIRTFLRPAAAGESVALTLVWNREDTLLDPIDDLDLRVRNPQGTVIAWSASQLDNVEQIRFDATSSGVYRVEVIPIATVGDSTVTFALGGIESPSIQSVCNGGTTVAIAGTTPALIPALVPTAQNEVVVAGCGFTGATSLMVAGQTLLPGVGFDVLSDNALVFDMPLPQLLGSQPLSVQTPFGLALAAIEVVAPPPTLRLETPAISTSIPGQVRLGAKPGDVYVVGASTSLSPTVIPGILSIDIGNGGASLLVLSSNVIGANGTSLETYPVPASVPFGLTVYLQAVVFDAASLALPLASTQVGSAFVTL